MADPPAVPVVHAGPVRVGSPIAVRPPVHTGYDVDETGDPEQPATLDDLADVDAPPDAVGVLTRTAGGGPATFRPTSHRHVQDTPVSTWLIPHGLPFTPAGIQVTGLAGQRIHPRAIAHTPGQTRLEFAYAVAGTADLS